MKSLVIYLVALVLGSGLGAMGMGAYNVMVVGVEMPADSLAASDSLSHSDDTATDSGDVGTTDPEVVAGGSENDSTTTDPAVTVADGGEGGAVGVGGGDASPAGSDTPVEGGQTTTPVEVAQVPPPDPDSLARAQQNYQRLARIFAAMKPDEAAPVLSQLDDSQLEGILLAMQGRNAAPILAAMDPERAASISRRVLGGS